MKELFKIDATYHSSGTVIFKWQPGGVLATAGANGLVHVFDRHEQVDEISLRSGSPVLDLQWDHVANPLLCCSRATVRCQSGTRPPQRQHD